MNHHKLKHCEINFWCQLPAWSVWGLWQTSSAFFPINSYRMKENCNQIKISIPHCSMNQKLLISLGKAVSISLGSFGDWLLWAGLGWHTLAPPQQPLPADTLAVPRGGAVPAFVQTHGRLMDPHPSFAQGHVLSSPWEGSQSLPSCICLTSHKPPVTHSLLFGFSSHNVKKRTQKLLCIWSLFSPPNNISTYIDSDFKEKATWSEVIL